MSAPQVVSYVIRMASQLKTWHRIRESTGSSWPVCSQNLVSYRGPSTCGDVSRLMRCQLWFVSNSCHLFSWAEPRSEKVLSAGIRDYVFRQRDNALARNQDLQPLATSWKFKTA